MVVNLREEQKLGIGFVGCWNMALKWLAENDRTDGGHVNSNELPRENVEL